MNSPIVSMSPNALSKEVADVGVEKVLEAIRSGKYADQIEAVRVVYQEEGKKAGEKFKAHDAVPPSESSEVASSITISSSVFGGPFLKTPANIQIYRAATASMNTA